MSQIDAEYTSATTRNVIEKMASNGLRTIGLAYKDFVLENPAVNEMLISEDVDWNNEQLLREGMTLIAIVGIQDPVRQGN